MEQAMSLSYWQDAQYRAGYDAYWAGEPYRAEAHRTWREGYRAAQADEDRSEQARWA
jgi:hypothetical protein